MKRNLALLVFTTTLFLLNVKAQIPNPSFETWTGVNISPTSWTAYNSPGFYTVTQSNDAHIGSSSAKIRVVQSGFYICGKMNTKFAENLIPDSITGWYKAYLPAETLKVVVDISNSAGVVGATGSLLIINDSLLTYTKFLVSITDTTTNYNNSNPNYPFVPDSANVLIKILDPFGSVTTGVPNTYVLVDDLNVFLPTASGINSINKNNSFNCIPNPANSITTINYSVQKNTSLKIELFDIYGKKIKDIINEQQNTGSYKLDVDIADLPAGNYLFRYTSDTFFTSQKFTKIK